jgi:hypothetical protein
MAGNCVVKLIPIAIGVLMIGMGSSPLPDHLTLEIHGDHWVMWNTAMNDAEYLHVFMPGSGQLPEIRSQWVLEGAAEMGLRAIALAYENNGQVHLLCMDSKDPDCMEKMRLERIYGVDTSDIVQCDETESVVGQLTSLHLDLHEEHPPCRRSDTTGSTMQRTVRRTPSFSKQITRCYWASDPAIGLMSKPPVRLMVSTGSSLRRRH